MWLAYKYFWIILFYLEKGSQHYFFLLFLFNQTLGHTSLDFSGVGELSELLNIPRDRFFSSVFSDQDFSSTKFPFFHLLPSWSLFRHLLSLLELSASKKILLSTFLPTDMLHSRIKMKNPIHQHSTIGIWYKILIGWLFSIAMRRGLGLRITRLLNPKIFKQCLPHWVHVNL